MEKEFKMERGEVKLIIVPKF